MFVRLFIFSHVHKDFATHTKKKKEKKKKKYKICIFWLEEASRELERHISSYYVQLLLLQFMNLIQYVWGTWEEGGGDYNNIPTNVLNDKFT